MVKKKKQTRRANAKYPALDPSLNLRSRYEELYIDYVDKLSEKDKKWLNSFNEEAVNANMKHKGPKLHKTKEKKRECYNRNNARNRDVLTRGKASGQLNYLNDLKIEERHTKSPEDIMSEKETVTELEKILAEKLATRSKKK